MTTIGTFLCYHQQFFPTSIQEQKARALGNLDSAHLRYN